MSAHRGQLRYPITSRGQFSAGDPPVSVGVRLVDISAVGVSFSGDAVIAVGARGRLSFAAVGISETIEASLPVTVQTCVLERSGYRIGALFSLDDAAARAQIERVIAVRSQAVKGR